MQKAEVMKAKGFTRLRVLYCFANNHSFVHVSIISWRKRYKSDFRKVYLYCCEWLIELRRYRELGRRNRLKTPGCLLKTFYHHRCLFALLKNIRKSNSLQISGPSRLLLNLQTHSNLNVPNRNALHKLKC